MIEASSPLVSYYTITIHIFCKLINLTVVKLVLVKFLAPSVGLFSHLLATTILKRHTCFIIQSWDI